LFRSAAGGTVFLDEVAEMPPSMQAKLLRVLEQGEIVALGESVPTKVDVRVLSATNRLLRADVQAGKFRSDLFYRIAVFPIKLPPLRERREDIALLVQRFLKRAAERQGKLVSGFDDTALAALAAYSWPGNIRELQNEVERAVALARDGGQLGLRHISSSIRDSAGESVTPESAPNTNLLSASVHGDRVVGSDDGTTFREARAAFEARFITTTLARCDGNISQAAKLMGISRVQLQRKIKEYGLR
jgi:transcriptional regulator with PAS, ATPase and Fis domain